MSTPDIVAELEAWLRETVNEIHGPTPPMIQRARDRLREQEQEIVALRREWREFRAEALEEAAHMCETLANTLDWDAYRACAAAIRALKDTPNATHAPPAYW